MHSLQRGKRASGDLIPWTISQQVLFRILLRTFARVCSWGINKYAEAGRSSLKAFFQQSLKIIILWNRGYDCIHFHLQVCTLSLIQFQDNDFPSLSGGRVVRIATHPDYQGVSRATVYRSSLEGLFCYFV